MSAAPNPAELTRFLNDLGLGHSEAEGDLMPHVFGELRRIAAAYLRGDRPGETLQPTALVNEAYLKLFGSAELEWDSRKHFFVVAAKAMRQLVIDHARRRSSEKRGGGRQAVTLDEHVAQATGIDFDLVDLDAALVEFEALDERRCRVVELRYFAGLEVEEVARVLDVSTTTVERDWRFARAWLGRRLGS